MSIQDTTLLISQRPYPERAPIVEEWASEGGDVISLDRFWNPSTRNVRSAAAVYGNGHFCQTVAEIMGLRLVTPSNKLLISLRPKWRKRTIRCETLKNVSIAGERKFVKPLQQKLFKSGVYREMNVFRNECADLPPDTQVLVSEPVHFLSEVRVFILDGAVADCCPYYGNASREEVIRFSQALTREAELSGAFVLDVGKIKDRGWAVIEFNPAWGACLRGCGARLVINCIASATSRPEQ
ncbi:MAG: ATP-grasp domain-containing protein [Proteobacteria bacterium]|nr:ATP-grasp domain-containing protein [Pseudomonadota bacterium]